MASDLNSFMLKRLNVITMFLYFIRISWSWVVSQNPFVYIWFWQPCT